MARKKQRIQTAAPAPALNGAMLGPPKIAPMPVTTPPIARKRTGIQQANNVALAMKGRKPGVY